jgi:succinyl-CoA synthetase beta subunit
MKIHEFQAKALLAQYGIPVPRGKVASSPAEARQIAAEIGRKTVIKAQVYAGGRGKAGGIKTINSPEEAESATSQLIGTRLVTHQTGPEGAPVNKVLVEEASPVARELYLSILVDGTSRLPVMMASEAGGMEIEEVAQSTPEKIFRSDIDSAIGFQPFQGRKLAYGMNLDRGEVNEATRLMTNLYKLFVEKDCSLAEINPLVITVDGKLLALDAKLNFDDNALYRHEDIQELQDKEQEEPLEVQARDWGINNYVKMDIRFPVVVRLAGTNLEEGQRILAESGISFIQAKDFYDAAHKAVQEAKNSG